MLKNTQSGDMEWIRSLNGHSIGVTSSLQFSADGSKLLFTGYVDNQFGIWQSSVTSLIDPNRAHQIEITSIGGHSLSGGSGIDTVRYSQGLTLQSLQISYSAGQLSVRQSGSENVDLFQNVERLQTPYGAIAFDTAGTAGQAYRIYQAAFNRTPDQSGLGFWIKTLDNGASLHDVAQGFVDSSEFKQMYGSAASNGEIVSRFYQNVLHRNGEASGMQFWTDVLDQHRADVAGVLGSFSESPENQAALIGVMQNGISYLV